MVLLITLNNKHFTGECLMHQRRKLSLEDHYDGYTDQESNGSDHCASLLLRNPSTEESDSKDHFFFMSPKDPPTKRLAHSQHLKCE